MNKIEVSVYNVKIIGYFHANTVICKIPMPKNWFLKFLSVYLGVILQNGWKGF